jgi:hypothetical protein
MTEPNPGDSWEEHYRGMTFHMNSNGEMWWRQYDGSGRLYVDDPPSELLRNLQDVKPKGAQFRVTEENDVIAKVEESGDEYDEVWVGRLEKEVELVPDEGKEYSIETNPDGLSSGDLWPGVYDGTRYSMRNPESVWWHNPSSRLRHHVKEGSMPQSILQEIYRRKPEGGSFRVTPWGNVITLISTVPEPKKVTEQFEELPTVTKNIIQMRKQRGLDMLPVYIGSIEADKIRTGEPRRVDDEVTDEMLEDIESWIKNLGEVNPGSQVEEETSYDDDPAEWAVKKLEDEGDYD